MKQAFFVTPIGEQGSDERERADSVLKHVLTPALSDYEIIRADKIENPGSINVDIIERLYKSDLVVADLTGFNPNVMYEVGVRHSFNLPIIQFAQQGQRLPFDLATERTIFFDLAKLDSVEEAKNRIGAAEAAISGGEKYLGPVSRALNVAAVFSDESDIAQAIETLSDQIEALGESMWQYSGSIDNFDRDAEYKLSHLFNLVSGLTTYEAEKLVRHAKTIAKKNTRLISLSIIHLQRRDKRLLRDVHLAELAHLLLTRFLLVQQFAFPRRVAAVAFRRHVFAHRR